MFTIQLMTRTASVLLISLSLTFSIHRTIYALAEAPVSSLNASVPTVDLFSATSPSSSRDIPITLFSASDDVGVTAYMITTSSVAPAATDIGWSGTTPTIFTVNADGSYILYPWVKDGDDNVSAEFGSPVNVTVDTAAPETSIDSQLSNPSNNTAAVFTFSGNDGSGTGIASFECQIDGNGYSACTSGADFGPISTARTLSTSARLIMRAILICHQLPTLGPWIRLHQ